MLSTGQGSHIGLFSYYTVLNVAILFIAQQRSWRMLNLVGLAANIGARMLQTPGWLIWASVLVLHFWILRIINTHTGVNNEITARDSLSYATHVGGVWLITLYAG